jgi:hypothetical protein
MPINPADQYQISNQLLYPLDDPTTAFRNALQDTGVNPYASNPFITQLMKGAQGARISFLANQAQKGTAPAGDQPSLNYANFLHQALSGGAGSGLFNQLNTTAQGYPDLIRQVKQYEASLAGGQTGAAAGNPYMAGLRDIFGNDNGMGALSAYASLRTPSLGALGSAWTSGLQNAGQSAMRQFAQQGTPSDSPWDWLFGLNGHGSPGGAF